MRNLPPVFLKGRKYLKEEYYIFGNEDLDELSKCELGTFSILLRLSVFLKYVFLFI